VIDLMEPTTRVELVTCRLRIASRLVLLLGLLDLGALDRDKSVQKAAQSATQAQPKFADAK
jgi:hypothetical protein